MNATGRQAVDWTVEHAVELVDELLGKKWDRRSGEFIDEAPVIEVEEPVVATCSCGSGIPVQTVTINGEAVTLIALPAIFQQFHEQGRAPCDDAIRELLDMVKIYNAVPAEQEASYQTMLQREYTAFCAKGMA